MTKAGIIQIVAKKTGVSKTDTQLIIQEMLATIKHTLITGESVYLRNFGTFSQRKQAKRTGYHFKAKKEMVIPAQRKVHFKPSQNLLLHPNSESKNPLYSTY